MSSPFLLNALVVFACLYISNNEYVTHLTDTSEISEVISITADYNINNETSSDLELKNVPVIIKNSSKKLNYHQVNLNSSILDQNISSHLFPSSEVSIQNINKDEYLQNSDNNEIVDTVFEPLVTAATIAPDAKHSSDGTIAKNKIRNLVLNLKTTPLPIHSDNTSQPLNVIDSTPSETVSLDYTTETSTMSDNETTSAKSESEHIMDKWKDLLKDIKRRTDSVIKKALPKIIAYRQHVNISGSCSASVMKMMSGLRNLKSWAVKMVDASGRFPSGSIEGTFTDLGDYDQCLDISYGDKKGRPKIKGQYCTVDVKPLLPAIKSGVNLNTKVLNFSSAGKDSVMSDLSQASALFHIMVLRIGICVPSLCSQEDIKQLGDVALRKFPVQVAVRNCEVHKGFRLTISQVIILSVGLLILVLIACGTALDHYLLGRDVKPADIGRLRLSLVAFSASSNIRQMMKRPSKVSTLSSVNGIRCLSLAWIILAHTYGFGHRQGLAGLARAKKYMEDIPFQILTNAWVSVDTFFMIGGLLVATSNLRSMEKTSGKIDIIHYIVHRIWRLTPPLAATLAVMFLLPLVGSGPLWPDMVGRKVMNCEKRWWQALLPVNAWVDFDSMCLLHSWYIAADLHFYSFAPIALIALYKWPIVGFFVLLLVTTVCAIVSGLLTILYHLPPTVIFFSPDLELTKKTANLMYFRPYPHMGAYCVGICLGYILWKHRKYSFNWFSQITGWTFSFIICLSVLFATYPWSKGQAASLATASIYSMTHRTAWAAGVAWVIFMCSTGHGGLLNRLLSWQFFVPLSRLSYCVYLLHFLVLWVRVSWRRTLLNFHHYDIVTEFFGILMVTLGLSVFFHIAFEAPFLKLEEIWFPRKKEQPPKNKCEVNIT